MKNADAMLADFMLNVYLLCSVRSPHMGRWASLNSTNIWCSQKCQIKSLYLPLISWSLGFHNTAAAGYDIPSSSSSSSSSSSYSSSRDLATIGEELQWRSFFFSIFLDDAEFMVGSGVGSEIDESEMRRESNRNVSTSSVTLTSQMLLSRSRFFSYHRASKDAGFSLLSFSRYRRLSRTWRQVKDLNVSFRFRLKSLHFSCWWPTIYSKMV